ncbi:dihydroorotase [Flavobacteriaceae bacterium]|nr:dihydroorotase [Flavobacteriaceae bacterium]
MKILLKNATIIDPKGAFHLQQVDIYICNGILEEIGEHLSMEVDKIIKKENLHVSMGWFDSSVCFGEPGYEERETLENGLKTAALSGFTDIALEPETNPRVDAQSAVVQLKKYTTNSPTALHPIASFTKGQEGKYLTEFFDLQNHGASAFGDFLNPIENPELLKTALLYSQAFDALLLSTPNDNRIGSQGVAHEGKMSTQLGLSGIPTINETLQINRDLHVLSYTGGKLHIPCISSSESVAIIREAKKNGLDISCSVALANLCYTEKQLIGFDTNAKLLPPLRTKEDQAALKEGLLDGTIDMVTSHHQPLNKELKHVEFEHAAPGTIGLEAMFGVLMTLFPLEKTLHLLTKGKKRFGVQESKIQLGEKACLSLFNPDGSSNFTKEDIYSSAKNCVFIGQTIQGKVYGSIHGNKQMIL